MKLHLATASFGCEFNDSIQLNLDFSTVRYLSELSVEGFVTDCPLIVQTVSKPHFMDFHL
jgi:hypothetical protein